MIDQELPLMERLLNYATHSTRDPVLAPRLCAESHTLIEKLTLALRDVEWSGEDAGGSGRCPQCDGHRTQGHKPACILSLALTAAQVAGVQP